MGTGQAGWVDEFRFMVYRAYHSRLRELGHGLVESTGVTAVVYGKILSSIWSVRKNLHIRIMKSEVS